VSTFFCAPFTALNTAVVTQIMGRCEFLVMDLIRFRGQFLKGVYDVHDGQYEDPAPAPAVHG
jgi:hypothetical protein